MILNLLKKSIFSIKRKLKIRPNWVVVNQNMKYENRDNLRIITVGRLVKQKNYELFNQRIL
ncbi:hypothetical protein CM15mP35_09360 [bacterium]|nr:MAG: hypothetical protein CM15mP35_09360 [bacterium]